MTFKKRMAFAPLILVPMVSLLTGCNVSGMAADSPDQFTEKTASTSQEAIDKGILPSWVPKNATNVKLVQRNSGPERIFTMDLAEKFTATQCSSIDTVGKPSAKELAAAYASDERTKNFKPEEMAQERTLQADWWPEGTEAKTTDLCGRFWVHEADGKLFAFTPDTKEKVADVLEERAAKAKREQS
ncbi:hypothetical protein [Arthrobacter sp. NIO-1057]|uniref:hypothetical protein n=1 Tax=Arthrobacter sp. NIO-1057 TaxID=993071 RepID=UPI00081785B3|nr:hypothetical protein [Arthrobacter sp. NIO-1057]SCC26623.1 hypothetical protein GA0061084_1887 [Arthrobacter sp. NIO-1057]